MEYFKVGPILPRIQAYLPRKKLSDTHTKSETRLHKSAECLPLFLKYLKVYFACSYHPMASIMAKSKLNSPSYLQTKKSCRFLDHEPQTKHKQPFEKKTSTVQYQEVTQQFGPQLTMFGRAAKDPEKNTQMARTLEFWGQWNRMSRTLSCPGAGERTVDYRGQ